MGSTVDKTLSITRLIHAPRELVFEVWTNPEHMRQWWGPNGFTTTIHKMETKPGGTWEFIMHGPDGTDYDNLHVINEVVPGEKLRYTHKSYPEFEVIVTFVSQGENTVLTMTSIFQSAEQLKQVIEEFGAAEGMVQHIGRLEAYLLHVTLAK